MVLIDCQFSLLTASIFSVKQETKSPHSIKDVVGDAGRWKRKKVQSGHPQKRTEWMREQSGNVIIKTNLYVVLNLTLYSSEHFCFRFFCSHI